MDTAQADGVLAPLGTQTVRHRASIYAEDVIIFSKPLLSEINAVSQILNLFGNATSLKTNMVKSKIILIQCDHTDLSDIQTALGCHPRIYLGMPLSERRLKWQDLQLLIEKIMKKIAGWKARWISTPGRVTLVRFVLSAMPIFQLLVVEQPNWVFKKIDKLRRTFLWAGSDSVSGGKCLVKWSLVCSPLKLGGLGIHVLYRQSKALKVR